MPTVLFIVKATIPRDNEDAFTMKPLRAEYDAHFGMSERARSAYVQVWP
jgi:hypothetical protein